MFTVQQSKTILSSNSFNSSSVMTTSTNKWKQHCQSDPSFVSFDEVLPQSIMVLGTSAVGGWSLQGLFVHNGQAVMRDLWVDSLLYVLPISWKCKFGMDWSYQPLINKELCGSLA